MYIIILLYILSNNFMTIAKTFSCVVLFVVYTLFCNLLILQILTHSHIMQRQSKRLGYFNKFVRVFLKCENV